MDHVLKQLVQILRLSSLKIGLTTLRIVAVKIVLSFNDRFKAKHINCRALEGQNVTRQFQECYHRSGMFQMLGHSNVHMIIKNVEHFDIQFMEKDPESVGGKRFETYTSTLTAYPDTLLGAMFSARNRRMRRADGNGEFFFDRRPHPTAVLPNTRVRPSEAQQLHGWLRNATGMDGHGVG